MKKYNQPTTEVFAFQTERLLQDFNVSVNGGGGGGGMHAPERSNPIPD